MEKKLNPPVAGRTPIIPTNRELTISLVGSIIRFGIDVPQVLLRREQLSPDKLLFLLLPIIRNLGKLIDRIRHSSAAVGRDASNGSGRLPSHRGVHYSAASNNATTSGVQKRSDNATTAPPTKTTETLTSSTWPATEKASGPLNLHRQRQQQQPMRPCTAPSSLMSDEDESNVAFEILQDPAQGTQRRQVLRQRDGNYAIRETTDTRGADGTFQRITKTISGPDVTVLKNITSQLSELPTLMPRGEK
ncbi:uncharacterized protein LOC128724414 [Anopheles nili]|uniref:uncharacterized protein LOC128724414 n=1 Tax=Anopheles nili TaxID=185578 RepID=UPI00237A6C4A|nr:uncharacterized protein LOC128724414 [Anopheles nili]